MGAQHCGISGIGTVTGYGWGREVLWDGLVSSKVAATLTGWHGPGRDRSGLGGDRPGRR